MARDEGNGLFRRIFCCGRQGLWGKKVACPRLRIPPRLRGFASGSRDVLELQGQEDAASSQSNRGPTAGGHRPGSLSKGHPTDGMRPIGRSSSSTSTALKVKQRRTLSSSSSSSSSLRERRSGSGDGGGDADCGGEMDPGDLGVPPMINLIPPTPSNLMDDDRFFQTTSEEGRSAQSSCNKRAARPGSPKKRHAGSCRSSQGPQIKTSSSTCCDHVGLVEGEASVISPDNPVKPSRHLLEEFLEVNSENVPLQLGFNPSWNLENNFDSEADSNASSHVDLVGNYPMAQQDTRKNDLNNKETVSKDLVKTNPQLKPLDTKPDSTLHIKRLAMRSCSLGDVKTNVGDLRSLGLSVDPGAEGGELPRQRRVTVASYVPSCLDQGENLKDKVETKEQRGKSLEEMNTLEVCEWFKNLGLQRSVPFIKEAKLQGHQLTAIDLDTLDLLQLADTEEKETLLSSIYKELHPTDTTGQSIDQLLETIGPYDVERFTAALAGLSPSQAPGPSERIDHPSRREDKHTEEKTIKKSNLVNLSMKAFERKLKLKVPSNSTAADVIEACWKILGLKDDVRLLTLNTVTDTAGKVLEELQADEQIGELKLLGRKELKLQLCKKPSDNLSGMDTEMGQVEEQVGNGSPSPELAQEPGVAATSPQGSPQSGHPKGAEAEENEANEWNQRTMIAGLRKRFFSLQQETAGLFAEGAFLTNPRPDPKGSEPKVRLIRHLGLAQQVLDNNSSSSTDKNLLELLKLDYLMLKERTQPLAAWNSLHEFQHGQTNSYWQSVTFSQLIAPHCTAVLVRVQLTARPDGYGFTVKWSADRGLQIETAENTGLQPNDRSASAVPDVYIKMIIDIKLTSHVRALEKLVEVNGVCVLSALEDELGSYLTTPTAHIVALRNPAPSKLGSLNWGETDDVPKPD